MLSWRLRCFEAECGAPLDRLPATPYLPELLALVSEGGDGADGEQRGGRRRAEGGYVLRRKVDGAGEGADGGGERGLVPPSVLLELLASATVKGSGAVDVRYGQRASKVKYGKRGVTVSTEQGVDWSFCASYVYMSSALNPLHASSLSSSPPFFLPRPSSPCQIRITSSSDSYPSHSQESHLRPMWPS